MYKKVIDNPNLVRDTFSNAILNNDVSAYKEAMQKRKQKEEHDNMVIKLNKVENDINDIKTLLEKIANK